MKGYFRQIGEAVRYLHKEKKLTHNDIKPENIGLCGERATLMDLEFSCGREYFKKCANIREIWDNRTLLHHSP